MMYVVRSVPTPEDGVSSSTQLAELALANQLPPYIDNEIRRFDIADRCRANANLCCANALVSCMFEIELL
jgi:hypothetical protein